MHLSSDDVKSLLIIGAFAANYYKCWQNGRRQKETHTLINSRMDELLEATGGEQRALGKAEGRAEQKQEEGRHE